MNYKINKQIIANQIRLKTENGSDIVNTSFALNQAKLVNLDLIEISPTAFPPVCIIEDYKKFLYNKRKQNKPQQKQQTKELQLSPNIGENDYQTKLNQAKSFLNKKFNVKVSILFKGRMIDHSEMGEIVLLRFSQDLIEYGKLQSMPKLEGKRMIIYIVHK